MARKRGLARVYKVCPVCCDTIETRTEIWLDTTVDVESSSIAEDKQLSGFSDTICPKCAAIAKADGVWIVEVDAIRTTDAQNPWRTGRLWCVTAEYVTRVLNDPEIAEEIIHKQMAYMPIEVAMIIFGTEKSGNTYDN